MTDPSNEYLILAVRSAFEAGLAIMKIYGKKTFKTKLKEDQSPVTEADYAAHRIIAELLEPTDIPLLSEEGKEIPYHVRNSWNMYWLIDPLDGTKEFIRRKDEFTVNIALIENHTPVMGIIYAPCLDVMYFASNQIGAYRMTEYSNKEGQFQTPEEMLVYAEKLPLKITHRPYTVIASRSHLNEETAMFITRLRKMYSGLTLVSIGSSLKFCLMAEGQADIYPRFGPTCEWDTAAGQAIARFSGCTIKIHNRDEYLSYNKENLTNPWFIVSRN